MITFFNKKDIVEFGKYLYSKKRRDLFEELTNELKLNGIDVLPTEERLKQIHHSDIENFILEQNSNP